MISEAVTLPQIRRGIIGKEKEIPVIDSDKEWYEGHKSEILSTLEKALNVDDKTLKIKLQKFDTDDFFTKDKPRKLKIKNLLKSVRKNFISEVERMHQIEDKTIGIDTQYEMMKMENGVEVYAVYSPMANRYLTHNKLWVQGCFSPTWCIASSSANNYWNMYHLYEADFPSVFIVAQKKNSVYNPIKYELKCNPYKSLQFKTGEISLKDWVDEWREPEQHEKIYNETSLFDSFNITVEDLENVIRKLLNTKKAEGFSKKYGKEMIDLYTEKIKSRDEDTKLEYLTKACKNGTFINFCDKIDKDDKEYFLDELIRYGTLTEVEVKKMELMNNEKTLLKALLNLIKNKRCTYLSLEWAKKYFDGNMVKRVYHSLPDEILLMENFEGINVRAKIFETIRNVDGLTTEYANYLIQKGEVNNVTLVYVRKDKEPLTKCVDYLIKNGKVDNDTLDYVRKDKESLTKCVDYLIKNGKVDNDTLEYVRNDEELSTKCIYSMIENDKVDNTTLINYVNKDDKELLTKCLYSMIENGKVNNDTLHYYVKNDKELLSKCIYSMIENGKVNNFTLRFVRNDKELLRKCVDNLISKNCVDDNALKYVGCDEESLRKCVDYLISKNKIDRKTLSELFGVDKTSIIKKVLIYLADKNKVYVIYYALRDGRFNEKNIATLCKILDEREMNDVLRELLFYEDSFDDYYIRLYEEILKRCSSSTKIISCSMLFDRESLDVDDILNTTFENSEDDESILKNLVKCFINSGYKSYFDKALNDDYEGRYALYYLINNLEKNNKGDYFEKSIENVEMFENTYKDFISFLKQNKEYFERAERWIGYPLFGESEEKNKITQMRNLYILFERKYKENGLKLNEEIVDIIREMVDIGFFKRNKTSYRLIDALVDGDNIPEDNVKLIEEILKQIGEENYNDEILGYVTWNKKFYKFIPHIVDVLISKNDIGASLMDIIYDDEIIDVNSAKKLANWIIKNKNTIDKETKMSVDYVKEKYPEIYKELFGNKL